MVFDGSIDLKEFDESITLAKNALIKIHEMQLNTLKNKYIAIQEEYSGGENKK
jgi:hypothetical protein